MHACVCICIGVHNACVHVCGGQRRPLECLSSGTVHSFKKARSLLFSMELNVLARVANCPVRLRDLPVSASPGLEYRHAALRPRFVNVGSGDRTLVLLLARQVLY